MENLIISKENDLIDIADAIREQTGETGMMGIKEIPSKIRTLSVGQNVPTKVSQLENDLNFISEDQLEDLYKKMASNTTLGFYCIEDVTVVIDGVSSIYSANSNVEIKMLEDSVFEIIPT